MRKSNLNICIPFFFYNILFEIYIYHKNNYGPYKVLGPYSICAYEKMARLLARSHSLKIPCCHTDTSEN